MGEAVEQTPAERRASLDFTPRFRVERVSSTPAHTLSVFFNDLGRSLEWNPADADHYPGSPQDVAECVANTIRDDAGLAPHFRIEPITQSAEGATGNGPAGDAAQTEDPAPDAPATDEPSKGGRRKRQTEPAQ